MNAKARSAWRNRLNAFTGSGEVLWIPETSLSRVEVTQRPLWGAIAAPGEETTTIRTAPGSK